MATLTPAQRMDLRFPVQLVAVLAHRVQLGEGGPVVQAAALQVQEVTLVLRCQRLDQIPAQNKVGV